MAVDECEPCCDFQAHFGSDELARVNIGRLLCRILEEISEGGGVGTDVNLISIGGAAVTIEGMGIHAEGETFTAGDFGVLGLARYTTSGQLAGPGNNEYGPLVVLNGTGALLTSITRTGFSTDPVRAEDEPLSSGESGIVVLMQRQTNPSSDTSNTNDAEYLKGNDLGYLYADTILRSVPTASNPVIASATNTTVLAANAARRYMEIQNNSGASVTISLAGFTLVGNGPNNTNVGFTLAAGATYKSSANYCSTSAITLYHTAGGPIDSISCLEA